MESNEDINVKLPTVDKKEIVTEKDLSDLFGIDMEKSMNNGDEYIIKSRVITKLQTEPAYYVEDGHKKLIVPLEALLFLNRDLNPLVNENGEIIISVKEEKIVNEIKELIISLKNNGQILFKTDEELISSIKEIVALVKDFGMTTTEIGSILKEKMIEKDLYIPNPLEVDEKIQMQALSSTMEVTTEAAPVVPEAAPVVPEAAPVVPVAAPVVPVAAPVVPVAAPVVPVAAPVVPVAAPVVPVAAPVNNMEDYGDISDLITPPKKESRVMTMDEMLENELAGMIITEPTKPVELDLNIMNFLHNMKWKSIDGMHLNWGSLQSEIETVMGSNDAISMLLNNIAKQKPLIFNSNKTVVFVDSMIFQYAIAQLFGVDTETAKSKFKKISPDARRQFEKGLEIALENIISDLIVGDKHFKKNYFVEGDVSFFGYGVWIELEAFKIAFLDEEFDFFRSFPYNDTIKPGVASNTSTRLVKDMSSTEI
jgi:hypothetical protein